MTKQHIFLLLFLCSAPSLLAMNEKPKKSSSSATTVKTTMPQERTLTHIQQQSKPLDSVKAAEAATILRQRSSSVGSSAKTTSTINSHGNGTQKNIGDSPKLTLDDYMGSVPKDKSTLADETGSSDSEDSPVVSEVNLEAGEEADDEKE